MDGGGGSQIGWVWGWSGVGWWSVAAKSANALESLVEHGLRLVVKIGAQPVLVAAWLAIEGWVLGVCGSGMREGWAEIFNCVMFMSVCEDCVRSVKLLKVK